MKVLVATAVGQGARKNDYNFCAEGELVWIGLVCARDRRDPDGGCGCGRGFSGMSSHRATTTARVADVALTREEYAEALRSSLERQGYGPDAPAIEETDQLHRLAKCWPVGTVVERRLDIVQARIWPQEVAS